jgi:predicted AlkP superfamily pyrophosphatase or phosphodiesterase
MAHLTAVIDVVGLSSSLLGESTPHLNRFMKKTDKRLLDPVLPAVTTTVQSSFLTGLPPSGHGIVGNGWYNREMAEVQFWKQSNHLVHGEKVWETARKKDSSITCAKIFWWYNMYSSADYSVTPRPIYKADGRKLPDVYSDPPEIRTRLQEELGTFPLFHFWGPASSIESSRWIAQAAMKIFQWHRPTLSLVYLPHLDYGLQKLGPGDPGIVGLTREVDEVVGELIDFYENHGARVLILSEYGIEPVSGSVPVNRLLREQGLLKVREEEGGELLDAGASEAFAVADHQVAHVYLNNRSLVPKVSDSLRNVSGIEQVLDRAGQTRVGLDHQRSGDLVLVSEKDRWFSYDYWLEETRAPDFARTVDIHRKPGYDPLELFLDPAIPFPKLKIAWKLLGKKLGFRTLMDVIPLDTSLVRGSHGRIDQEERFKPICLSPLEFENKEESLPCTQIRDLILRSLFS